MACTTFGFGDISPGGSIGLAGGGKALARPVMTGRSAWLTFLETLRGRPGRGRRS